VEEQLATKTCAALVDVVVGDGDPEVGAELLRRWRIEQKKPYDAAATLSPTKGALVLPPPASAS
jgi:hypothetical protein